MDVFTSQINKSRLIDYINRANTAVKNIERLANFPGGRLKAMHVLVESVATYCDDNEECNSTMFNCYYNGEDELEPMEDRMVELIREHYQATKLSKQPWDQTPSQIRQDKKQALSCLV